MKKFLAAIVAGLVFPACAPSTPQSRIERNPELFAALSKKEQSLVQQGQISRGMPPDAVVLAWGPPDQRFEGSRDSKPTERWDFLGSRPVQSPNHFGAFRSGFGGSGRFGYPGAGFGVGPDIVFIPYRRASVWFVNQRVDSWERIR